ncbi:MAG: hypothetical protein OJF49_003641 [Ktedonobacterales bacterium]|jgi:hypothetical protein|nr:MAG: hypothetical protein OJF49_003641 [Ktedonobacterales bacterium]
MQSNRNAKKVRVEDQAANRTKATDAQPMIAAKHGRAWRRSPWSVAALTLAFYCLWTLLYLNAGNDIYSFAHISQRFAHQSHTSQVITFPPDFHYAPIAGYDGQFAYFIAADPSHASPYLDKPNYRYTRILYPMLARLLALGRPDLLPYTMLLINLLAIGGGTLAVAAWLRRKGYSPWYALVYGLAGGLFIAYQFDLTEPLAYALVALAVYLYDFGGARRYLWAGLCFGLAALTRETTLLFALFYGAAWALRPGDISREAQTMRRTIALPRAWRGATALLALAVVPLALYKLFLSAWLGSSGVTSSDLPVLIPFQGLFAYWPWGHDQLQQVETVVLPALLCAGVALWAVWQGCRRLEIWNLLAHILLFVVLLHQGSYVDLTASARVTLGITLAAIYCLPAVGRVLRRGNALWLLAAGALWALPTFTALLNLIFG